VNETGCVFFRPSYSKGDDERKSILWEGPSHKIDIETT